MANSNACATFVPSDYSDIYGPPMTKSNSDTPVIEFPRAETIAQHIAEAIAREKAGIRREIKRLLERMELECSDYCNWQPKTTRLLRIILGKPEMMKEIIKELEDKKYIVIVNSRNIYPYMKISLV